jgi:hypothetical protein
LKAWQKLRPPKYEKECRHQQNYRNPFPIDMQFILTFFFCFTDHPQARLFQNGSDSSQLLELLNSSMPELLQQLPDMREITEYWIIYPQKTHVPLHNDDLLYESSLNSSSGNSLGKVFD